jgi:fructose/tagatose bisphosphate aldolase
VQPRAIIIHELTHARAALEAAAELGVPVELWSAPGAAAYAGAGWFDAVMRAAGNRVPAAVFIAVLDCHDRADLVQAALRQGLTHVCFRGGRAVAARLVDIARQYGATLHRKMPAALDLLYVDDPPTACRAWVAAGSTAD